MKQKMIIKVSGVIATLATSFIAAAHNKVVVIPLDSAEVAPYKMVFITNGEWNGDLGGASGADAKCQDEADNLLGSKVKGKKFKAWVSGGLATDFTTSSRTFTRSADPYKRVDGVKISNSYEALLASGVESEIEIMANGNRPNGLALGVFWLVWSGISNDGGFTTLDCNGWTVDSDVDSGTYGLSDNDRGEWTDGGSQGCQYLSRLYCFEQ